MGGNGRDCPGENEFSLHMCVCTCMLVYGLCACVFGGEKTKWGMEIEVKEEKSKNYAYVWVDCMCGWQAGRLWGIHMFSFLFLSHIHTHEHTHRYAHRMGRSVCLVVKNSAPSTQHILFRNISSHISPLPPPPPPPLFLILPGSDTEFFLTAVHSLQKPCNPHILHTHTHIQSLSPVSYTSEIKTASVSTSSSCPGL